MKSRVLLLASLTLLLASCLQDEIESNQVAVFDELWKTLDERYGGFAPRQIDWDDIYSKYRPLVSNDISSDSLWEVSKDMIDELDDQHVSIVDYVGERGHASDKEAEVSSEAEFSLQNILTTYLEPDFFANDFSDSGNTNKEVQFVHGLIKDHNIAYLYFPHFEFLNGWESEIDKAVEKYQSADGMIVDVRNNGGGSPIINRFAARRFVNTGDFIFSIQSKDGPGPTDFDEPIDYFAEPEGPLQFTKPIVTLANKSTVSAGEEFLLFLESQPHVTTMGDTTSNAFSTTAFEEFMPNGWAIGFPVQLYLYPDGSSPEGIGIIPDIPFVNEVAEVDLGMDKLLEKAIDQLQ